MVGTGVEALDERVARRLLLEELARSKTPGASLYRSGGDGVASIAVGYSSLEEQTPASPGSVYGIASITKVFTAVAVMKLVEEGRLSLDDPVEKYLPITLRVRGKPVTVEHLLSHTSGIPALGYAEAVVSTVYMGAPVHPVTRADVLGLLEEAAEKWAVAEPGERFLYLNEGYVALGLLIERVSGVSYEEYVTSNIARPLGMRYIFFSPRDAAGSGLLAQPYTFTSGRLQRLAPFALAWSDGGIYASAPDTAKLMEALAGRSDVEIISRSSVKEMMKPRALLDYQLYGDDSYGLGLTLYPSFPGGVLAGHSGGLPGYHSFAGFTSTGSVAALLANGDLPARDIVMALLASPGDPSSFETIRLSRLLDSMEGIYTGFHGMVKICLQRIGDSFIAESIEPRGLLREALHLERVDWLSDGARLTLKGRRGARTVTVEAVATASSVEMILGRYRLVRTAPCS